MYLKNYILFIFIIFTLKYQINDNGFFHKESTNNLACLIFDILIIITFKNIFYLKIHQNNIYKNLFLIPAHQNHKNTLKNN